MPAGALPLTQLHLPARWEVWLDFAPVKALLPLPVLLLVLPAVAWFFRDTWKELDKEAASHRAAMVEQGVTDRRALHCLLIVAVSLTIKDYFGGRPFYEEILRPFLASRQQAGWHFLHLEQFDELFGYGWWVFSRVFGYVLLPFPLWKLLHPRDSLLDFGLRTKGFLSHAWIYGLCTAVVVPLMLVVANQPDFGSYYPFYKQCSRSGLDLLLWESIYIIQFFALELFFRGFVVGALRPSFGSSAIIAMAVPYCMIHYGKPYLEAMGAIIAGIVLGSLAARTRSIYAGFLVHVTIALGMDLLALSHRHELPVHFWPALR